MIIAPGRPAVRRRVVLLIFFLLIFVNTLLIFSRMGDVCKPPVLPRNQLPYEELAIDDVEKTRMLDERLDVFHGNPVLGRSRPNRGFVTIGVPTVQREGGSYLLKTIDSLIRHTSDVEKMEIVIVILLADLDLNTRGQMADILETAYRTYIEDGFIQIIQIHRDFYPPLRNLERTFGDSDTRVRWRSKQAVDFAFLMLYCSNISEYYMQLEDDVISTPNFLNSIKQFIVKQSTPWACLEFSHMGFIGKFYHSKHLRKLAMFMRNFYSEQPVDFLFRYFNVLMTQKTTLMRTPSLFHHIGTVSSLAEKNLQGRRSVEEIQDALPKLHKGDNPPADISTNLKTFKAYTIDLAYETTPGHFWGLAPSGGEAVFLAFQEPVRLKRVIVETGSQAHSTDILRHGKLEASPRMISRLEDGRVLCTEYIDLGDFKDGHIDADDIDRLIPYDIHCLKITVSKRQESWLLIREVAVYVANVTDTSSFQH